MSKKPGDIFVAVPKGSGLGNLPELLKTLK
jgi:hypothetical protein